MPRHFGRRRRSMPRQVIQSYKKVLNFAPTSIGAGSTNYIMITGTDSVAAGQTGVTDAVVPTGCIVKSITIQCMFSQIVGGSVFLHLSVQHLRAGQSAIASNVIGGNPQRNQVFLQKAMSVGINQNMNPQMSLKIPSRFGRVREGDNWVLEVTNSNTIVTAVQVIYKFYR